MKASIKNVVNEVCQSTEQTRYGFGFLSSCVQWESIGWQSYFWWYTLLLLRIPFHEKTCTPDNRYAE
jgi:hypothetical protein